MDNELSILFTKRFKVDDSEALPNEDAKAIRILIEDCEYREALIKMIDYYGKNSVVALNDKIHKLKDELASSESECNDLRRSNDAEHREKMKLWDRAEQAARLLKRCFTMIGVPCLLDDAESARNDVNAFLENNRELLQ